MDETGHRDRSLSLLKFMPFSMSPIITAMFLVLRFPMERFLPEEIWRPVLEFAFIDPGLIGQTFIAFHDQTKNDPGGIGSKAKSLTQVIIHLKAKTAGRENESWELKVGGSSQ